MTNCKKLFASLVVLVLINALGFSQPNVVIIPYDAPGYKYLQTAWGGGAGFQAPGFNDAAWATDTAGFGITGSCPLNTSAHVKTPWAPNTDMLIRKHFTLPGGAGDVKVAVAIDNDVQVFVNGYDVSGGLRAHENCAAYGSFVFNVPSSALNAGDNVLAVRGHDRGVLTFLDVEVRADLPQVFYVTDTDDDLDLSVSGGAATFRQAILDANANGGVDTIKFNLPGSGVQTFTFASDLPYITDPVVIDGYTQPGSSPNSLASGNNAVLLIELNGENAIEGGLVVTGGGSTIRGLVVNRFVGPGIVLGSGQNVVEGNFIGTDATGAIDYGNDGDGVLATYYGSDPHHNRIGGNTPSARNLISGNQEDGINIVFGSFNAINGNYIGTNASGTSALPNGSEGVLIQVYSKATDEMERAAIAERKPVAGSSNHFVKNRPRRMNQNEAAPDAIVFDGDSNTVGGTAPGSGNLISGNSGCGIVVMTTGNVISGNYIGVNAAGSAALPNAEDGIAVIYYASKNLVAQNLVSGNGLAGVALGRAGYPVSENKLTGNLIGTNAIGTAAIPNNYEGVLINDESYENTVGGLTGADGNTISGNSGIGIGIVNAGQNSILGNYIGVDDGGSNALANQLDGVSISMTFASPDGNMIGGTAPGAGNIIAFNGDAGVRASAGVNNGILGNSIYSNGELGIDLGGDGVSLTESFGTSANNFQVFPTIAFAAFDLQGVAGFITSAPLTNYRIELFRNTVADPSGFGEGKTMMTALTCTTDSAGFGTFYVDLPGQLVQGEFVTATATDPQNNTSEFSGAVIVSLKVKIFGDHFVVNTTLSGIPLHWAEGNALFKISNNVPGAYQQSIIDGYAAWNNLPQVVYTNGGITDNTTWGGDPDGVNNSTWVASGWDALTGTDSNTIAVTRIRYNTLNGDITDADIAFDGEHFTWDETGTVPTAMDIQNTAAHEAGHFSGLGDIYNPGDPGYVPAMANGNQDVTMYGLIRRGETSKRTLDPPDSAGIAYIYSHIPASRVDLMLVVDGSAGFATTQNAFDASKNSAMALVQKLRVGDRLGVVRLPSNVVFPLTAIVDSATRAQATAAINGLVAGGASAIGSGLQAAQSQLNLSPLSTNARAMILFSAGEENAAPGALSVLGPVIAAETRIFSMGFTGSSGQALSNKLADSTGGLYYLAADTTIKNIVNQIWNELTGQQQTFYTTAPSDTFNNVPLPGLQWQGPVDRGTISILPGLQWQGPRGGALAEGAIVPSSYVLSLLPPGGGPLIDSAYVAQHPELGIQFISGPTYQFFKINNPIPGLWTLFVFGRSLPVETELVDISITAFTDITMAVATDKITYMPDETIQLSVALSAGGQGSSDPHITGGGPITDATVVARIKPPDPDTVHTVVLAHIGAGVYTGSFDNTSVPGTYNIEFNAKKDSVERGVSEAVFVGSLLPPPSNLIVNPGFELGPQPWVFYTAGTGNYTVGTPSASGTGAAKISIGTPGNNIQFYQSDITLEQNTQYRLKFKAFSSTGHDLSVFVHRHTSPYTNYGLNGQVFNLTNTWQEFSVVFTAINFPPPTPSNARLRFKLNGYAASGDVYYIDDVVLEKVSGGSPVATKVLVETAPDGTGSVVPAQTVATGTSITVYAISRDAGNAFVANVSSVWGLQNITGGVVAGDLAPNVDGKSAVFTANADGSAEIKATSGLLTPTASGKITVFTPPPPTNFITNGGFEAGATGWYFNTNGTGKLSIISPGSVGSKAAQIAITNQGTIVQFYQHGITLTSGQAYKLSFRAFSNTGHDVQASIFKHGSPNTPYGLPATAFNLTNGWATYSVNFTAGGFAGTVNDARLRFWLAPYDAFGDLYFFDEVKLEYASAPPDAGVLVAEESVPEEFSLGRNFPNPFNPSTTITFTLPVDAVVSLDVFNVLGQRVALLVDGTMSAGYHSAVFDAWDLSSGMYFYRLTARGSEGVLFARTERMVLAK